MFQLAFNCPVCEKKAGFEREKIFFNPKRSLLRTEKDILLLPLKAYVYLAQIATEI